MKKTLLSLLGFGQATTHLNTHSGTIPADTTVVTKFSSTSIPSTQF